MSRSEFFTRLLLLAVLNGFGASAFAELVRLDTDPTEPPVKVVSLEKPDLSIDKPAPISQFTRVNGEAVWQEARRRALGRDANYSGGAFDFRLVPDNFHSATNFYNERYNPGEVSENLMVIISAASARRNGKILELTMMRMIYFINETPVAPDPDDPNAPQVVPGVPTVKPQRRKPTKTRNDGTDPNDPAGKKKDKKNKAAPEMSVPGGGRMVILAPKCEIDLETNIGRASGGASIEIFPKPEDGKPLKSIARLHSPFINWRSWSEAASGSTEVVMYTCGENDSEEEPEVSGTYVNRLADGTESTITIKGRGMIFESGKFDRLTARADEDDRTVGLSLIARSRAIFHSHISTEMTASTMKSLMPFQGEAPAVAKKDKSKKLPPAPPEPERTLVTCEGPAVFDLAYIPRLNDNMADTVVAETVEVDLKEILLGKRFEFLNNVRLVKKPLDEKPLATGALDTTTSMACGHLRIQYPAGAMPSATSLPDYTEAIGGVRMSGYKPAPIPEPGQPLQPPTPFSIACDRMFFDGPRDNMFLVGTIKEPARVIDTMGLAQAIQFCFQRRTQRMTMPSAGPKLLVIRSGTMSGGAAPAPAATGAGEGNLLAGGDTIISWTGPLYREIQHLPVPHMPDVIKDILTLNNNVVIENKVTGLKMSGEKIRLFLEKNRPDFIEAIGDVEVIMGDLKALGNIVTVELGFDEQNQLTKNIITVIGNRKLGKKADVFKGGGSAVRSDKFIIDRIADSFSAFGGTVAIVKSEKPPAPPPLDPDAAKGAGGFMSGIKFESGGNIFIQCDGEFIQSGKSKTVTADQNVLIRQPGVRMLSNNVQITLGDDSASDAAKTFDPKIKSTTPNATPANALFSGDLKSIECFGMVELATDDKLIHCDIMKFDAKEQLTILDMLDAEDDVRIYIHSDDGSDKVMCARHNLKLNQKTGEFTPGGKMLILPYRHASPAPRGFQNSPGRKKAQ